MERISKLSDSLQLSKEFEVKNRIFMAPLTRLRTDDTGVPNDLMAEYYAQRAGSGLILTEASAVSPMATAFPGAGNIYNEE